MKTETIEKKWPTREMCEYQPDQKPKADTLIYSRKHSNGAACWWRPNGAGYTTDLNNAGRYTAEEAAACCEATHGGSEPVPEADVVGMETRRTLYRRDIEYLLSNPELSGPVKGDAQ